VRLLPDLDHTITCGADDEMVVAQGRNTQRSNGSRVVGRTQHSTARRYGGFALVVDFLQGVREMFKNESRANLNSRTCTTCTPSIIRTVY
jgi:hypothetical protein